MNDAARSGCWEWRQKLVGVKDPSGIGSTSRELREALVILAAFQDEGQTARLGGAAVLPSKALGASAHLRAESGEANMKII
eukprot:4357491-Pleurochrysis_carterae.AAC.1